MLDGLVGRAGQRRGFGEARILTEWAAIVGEEVAGCTLPERIARSRSPGSATEAGTAKGKAPATTQGTARGTAQGTGGGVLHLRVQSGWAPTVQHLAPVIVERINGYFGYAAIERLALRQGVIAPPRRRGPPPRRPLAAGERANLEAALAGVTDPDLAQALRALGEAVLSRQEAREDRKTPVPRRDAPVSPSS